MEVQIKNKKFSSQLKLGKESQSQPRQTRKKIIIKEEENFPSKGKGRRKGQCRGRELRSTTY